MNTSVPPHSLRPGETPYSLNLVTDEGVLKTRSGLSYFGALPDGMQPSVTTAVGIGLVAKANAVAGTPWWIAVSSSTYGFASYRTSETINWVSDNTNLASVFESGSSTSYFDWDIIYEPDSDENAVVATKGDGMPIYKTLDGSSDWTHVADFVSHESSAQCVASFDNRLLFFNTASPTTTYINRLRYSVRGDPLDFTSIGAGFEDIIDMRGFGTAAVPEEDQLILFSNKEVWSARPRRDAYAFDIDAVERSVGNPYPRSAVATPAGVIWLGPDFTFYRLQNNVVRPFSSDVKRYFDDNFDTTKAPECFATYDPAEQEYRCFWRDTGVTNPTMKAFYLKIESITQDPDNPLQDKGDWMLQSLPLISSGHEELIGEAAVGGQGISRIRADQQTDRGSNINHIWRSNAFRGSSDPTQMEGITDILVDLEYYKASTDTTTNIGISTSTNFSENYVSTTTVTLSAVSGVQTIHYPITPVASRYAQFELKQPNAAGSILYGPMSLYQFHITLRPWSGRRPY